ncbi:E3 ubiquitin-protein ligase TRIM56-like [Branchiostoma floridae]|uniref:E3 ubiquitin-protein ligase TRIM56-like n=1 Tax=Branchiostoma floridae TaxID=7739 RepID=A0A9J7KZJ2_BRAFL|nr:E3 ubiquitin-protein ligase TRIM56-like [Branchiostoma floridae]
METATWTEEATDDSLKCTICDDTFKNPKVLPCSHNFCRECLRVWIGPEESDVNGRDTFPCPRCRQPVPIPEHGVDGLKDNIFLANLVKAVAAHTKGRHGKDDILCTSCEEGKPATSRCSECAEFLCESCESAHRHLRDTKGHTLFTFEELKAGKYDDVFRGRKAPPCSKHPGEIVKLYCRTCETPICFECASFEHRDSRHNYTRIEEVASERREAMLDLTPQCQARIAFFHKTEEAQKRLKKQLQLNAEGARQNVQTQLTLVKEECERLQTCINAEETAKKQQIDAEIEGAQISLARAKSTCEFAETLAREGGDYEVVSCSQDMTTRLNDFTKPWPPAVTVDSELANINVDYSTLNQTLTKHSQQYHQSTSDNKETFANNTEVRKSTSGVPADQVVSPKLPQPRRDNIMTRSRKRSKALARQQKEATSERENALTRPMKETRSRAVPASNTRKRGLSTASDSSPPASQKKACGTHVDGDTTI